MYITHIEITDLRSFSGTHSVSLEHSAGRFAGWTVLAGRNGAGKSTLLKAIALAIVGPLASRSLAGVFTDWVRHGMATATVAIKISFDKQLDNFQLGGRTSKTPFWVGLRWTPNEHGPDTLGRWMEKESENRKRIPERGP